MNKAYVSAVAMLARREHGAFELAQKLLQKGYVQDEINAVIAECQRLGLQNDERFATTLCSARIRQGYGPRRIRQDLQQVKIDSALIEQTLNDERDNWMMYARKVWEKKYKLQKDTSFKALQKQKQFLLYRGFSSNTISMLFQMNFE